MLLLEQCKHPVLKKQSWQTIVHKHSFVQFWRQNNSLVCLVLKDELDVGCRTESPGVACTRKHELLKRIDWLVVHLYFLLLLAFVGRALLRVRIHDFEKFVYHPELVPFLRRFTPSHAPLARIQLCIDLHESVVAEVCASGDSCDVVELTFLVDVAQHVARIVVALQVNRDHSCVRQVQPMD